MTPTPPVLTQESVNRLWLHQQGLLSLNNRPKLTPKRFTQLLETIGALQVDSVNVVERAHYLTLFSRFGCYDKSKVDKWVYRDRAAYDYWGHEASILPASQLRFSLRRMQRFPSPRWKNSSYWETYQTSRASKSRVMRLIRQHGPLESLEFDASKKDANNRVILGWGSIIPKEDKRSLNLLWHAGKLAICDRTHFRKRFDLAENVYDQSVVPASKAEYFDNWLRVGLLGNGVICESHLTNYFTAPSLNASERKKVLTAAMKKQSMLRVAIEGDDRTFFTSEDLLSKVQSLPAASGTTLLCPFDSLLWQRKRAAEFLNFDYRVEIYVPEKKRQFGYYCMPILHEGRLVGRVDPKLHRESQLLEIRSLHYEPWFKPDRRFRAELVEAVQGLAEFLSASTIRYPKGSKLS